MDDGETATAAAKRIRRMRTPYMPHELVTEILARLPVDSLLRFSCVCKAWRATISGDASFRRRHLRLQKPCLLVSPQTQALYYLDEHLRPKDKIGLYRWEPNHQDTTVPLVHATDLSSDDSLHGFAHCDGLVLLPGEAAVTLPWSPGAVPPRREPAAFTTCHQAFGLGHDPRSNTYKVARYFYRYLHARATVLYQHRYTTGMEVFTIGTDQHWRETAAQPPYPVLPRRTATFFKGSLIWTVDEGNLPDPAPGFLRFSLQDEAFGVMPPPPCHPRLKDTVSGLGELRGELCLAYVVGSDNKLVEMWMCNDVEKPRWDRRYAVTISKFRLDLRPIAAFDGEIVFKEWHYDTRRYDLKTNTPPDP